jgi:hypothetical protein
MDAWLRHCPRIYLNRPRRTVTKPASWLKFQPGTTWIKVTHVICSVPSGKETRYQTWSDSTDPILLSPCRPIRMTHCTGWLSNLRSAPVLEIAGMWNVVFWLNSNTADPDKATYLERALLRSEKPFIVTPALNKCESSRLACCMGQCIHNILKQRFHRYHNHDQPDLHSGDTWFKSRMGHLPPSRQIPGQ